MSAESRGPSEQRPIDHPIVSELADLWWLPLVRGILLLILGTYALFRPGMTLATFAQVAGFFLVFDGVIAIVAGVIGQVPSRLWTVCRGLLAVLAGLFIFANPVIFGGIAVTVVMTMVGVVVIFSGVMEIVAAIQDRKEIEGEGWLMLGGFCLTLVGVGLLVAPLTFGLLTMRILGAMAILSSIAMIMFALRLKALGGQRSATD